MRLSGHFYQFLHSTACHICVFYSNNFMLLDLAGSCITRDLQQCFFYLWSVIMAWAVVSLVMAQAQMGPVSKASYGKTRTGVMDWSLGLVWWIGVLDWCSGLVLYLWFSVMAFLPANTHLHNEIICNLKLLSEGQKDPRTITTLGMLALMRL